MRRRSVLAIAVVLGCAACRGAESSTTVASGSSSAPSTASSASASPSPLVAPKGCEPNGPAVEISTINDSWADAHGHAIAPGEACLAVPHGPFTVTVHNDVHGQGIGTPNHNFAVFTDSSATEALFTGDLTYPQTSTTYHVPRLPAGTYLFHCDIHPQTMYGVLVVS